MVSSHRVLACADPHSGRSVRRLRRGGVIQWACFVQSVRLQDGRTDGYVFALLASKRSRLWANERTLMAAEPATTPVFFPTPAAFRAWLTRHHTTARELVVGFYKRDSGKPSITWPESVDQALCFGWIDSIRRSRDAVSYTIRFTPRRPGSTWSSINIRRAQELIAQRRMRPAGRRAFEARRENRSGIYTYEQRSADLEEPYVRLLKRNKAAWAFLKAQPPSYRKAVNWWIVSARREDTRRRRLEKLADFSAREKRLPETMPRKAGR